MDTLIKYNTVGKDQIYSEFINDFGKAVNACLPLVQSHIDTNKELYNYKIAGTTIQDRLAFELLKLHEYTTTLKESKDKNEYPDLNYANEIAIDVKAFIIERDNKRKTSCDNDMSPLNAWTNDVKKKSFKSHIQIWIGYRVNIDNSITITDFWVGHIWDFVGINDKKILQYREKDGNLRPKPIKDWGKSLLKDYDEFYEAVRETNIIRSSKISQKHIEITLKSLKTDMERFEFIDTMINHLKSTRASIMPTVSAT